MIKKQRYIFWLLLLAVVFFACNKKNDLPSLKETFSKNDKVPFGAYVMFQQVQQLFYQNSIRIKKTGFKKAFEGNSHTNALYVDISKNLYLTKADADAMLTYAANGNSIFISSENMDSLLLNELGVKESRLSFFGDGAHEYEYTSVLLQPAFFNDTNLYTYYYRPLQNHFTSFDAAHTKVLGTNSKKEPNYLLVFYGKGRFYLHSEPRALSNYFLLQKENYKYQQSLFSFMAAVPEYVFWDDYYNKINTVQDDEGRSSLSVLFKYPAMKWAFLLLVLLLLLYILFGGKRRQRIVPEITPNENTTVAFTETISRLYFQNKDNKDIADKMIAYFFEHIRNAYFLSTNNITEEFAAALSRKANVEEAITQKLLSTIATVQQAAAISDAQLLSLNHQIEKFYKNNK